MKKIDEIYAFVATDGDEGIVAFEAGGLMMPMVCADVARVDALMGVAKRISLEQNKQIAIYKFSKKEIYGVIKPS